MKTKMITPKMKEVLLIVVICSVIFIALRFLKKKIISFMLEKKIVSFIQKWEGGLSRDSTDTASKVTAPWRYRGVTGWHTNKGVTFETFKRYAPVIGYAVTAKNFFEMPNDLWLKIMKRGYLSAYPLDEINHLPRIQAVIIEWAWHSGLSGSEVRLANFQRAEMGINDSNITKREIIRNFKREITPLNEKVWFNKLCNRRLADLKRMPTWYKHGRGWTNRLNDFKKTFA